MQVLILGYGEMGHAMETLLGLRHELAIWEKYPQNGFVSVRLEDAAPAADFVVFCLPAGPHRETLTRIEPMLKHGCVCISVAKGLDDAGETVLDVFEQLLGKQHGFALLYGPMIAEDMRAGRYGFGQAGCSAAVFERVRELFRGSRLCLTHSEDPRGMSWSVVLKNVYAIAFGVVDGLELGDNVRGFLMVQAMRELSRIVTAMGGAPGTCYELAGLGDLVTTATSEHSHHHSLGARLARGETETVTGEGVHTLRMVASHGLLNMDYYPLLALVHTAIEDPQQLSEQIERFIVRCFAGPDAGPSTTRTSAG